MNRSSLYSQDAQRSALPFDVLPDAITSIKDAQKGQICTLFYPPFSLARFLQHCDTTVAI